MSRGLGVRQRAVLEACGEAVKDGVPQWISVGNPASCHRSQQISQGPTREPSVYEATRRAVHALAERGLVDVCWSPLRVRLALSQEQKKVEALANYHRALDIARRTRAAAAYDLALTWLEGAQRLGATDEELAP